MPATQTAVRIATPPAWHGAAAPLVRVSKPGNSAPIGSGILQRSAMTLADGPPNAKELKERAKLEKAQKENEKALAKTRRNQQAVSNQKAIDIQSRQEKVSFSASFNQHVMEGEISGNKHTGYHSQAEIDFANFGVCSAGKADKFGVLQADCKMKGKSESKVSTFFPIGWHITRIRAETSHAYARQVTKTTFAGAGSLSWVGPSTVPGLYIGSSSGLPLNTAFPSYEGDFA